MKMTPGKSFTFMLSMLLALGGLSEAAGVAVASGEAGALAGPGAQLETVAVAGGGDGRGEGARRGRVSGG